MITSQPSGAYLYINEGANGSVGQTPHRMETTSRYVQNHCRTRWLCTNKSNSQTTRGCLSQVALSLYSEREVAPVKFLIIGLDAQVYVDRRLKEKVR